MRKNYSELILKVRKKLRLSQEEFAECIHLKSRQIICNYERGNRRPSVEVWRRFIILANEAGYKVTIEHLFN